MTDHEAFLHAIIERPQDDLLRLVFADFLEETGESDRAEFIRLQIENASVDPDSPEWESRKLRCEALLREHDWRIPELRGKQEFRRGFVEVIGTTAAWLNGLPLTHFDTTPVRDLRVWNARNYLEDVAALPWMPRLEHLDLRNSDLGIGERLHQFFSRAQLDRLTSLGMRNNILWAEDLQTFFRTWPGQQLTALDLSANPLSDAGASTLALANLPNLERLILRTDDLPFADCMHSEGAALIAGSRTLTKIRYLDLRGHHIGDSGFISLIRGRNISRMEVLDVGFNDIGLTGDSALQTLLESPDLDELRVLRLNGNYLDRIWAEGLANWSRLETLETLDLRRARFGVGAERVLRESPWVSKMLFEEIGAN